MSVSPVGSLAVSGSPSSSSSVVGSVSYGHPSTYSRTSSISRASNTSSSSATSTTSPRAKLPLASPPSPPDAPAPSSSSVAVTGVVSPSRRLSHLSPRLANRVHTPKSSVTRIELPDHIAALNGRWDGECSIHGGHAQHTVDSEKANVWLGCHLAFSPLDGSLTMEHPHNAAAVCFATIRIRGHGHSIGSVDGTARKLIPFSLNGLLDGSSGAFELSVTASEGEYQAGLTSHGTIDFANRSLLADAKGRTGSLRLSFSGNQSTMTSTLRPHLSPKAVAKHLGLMSSAECGSGRPRSGAVLAKVITPAIAPCTPLQNLTPGTTAGPDPLSNLTSKEGAVRVWAGQLVRHGTEHTAMLSECVIAFNVSNDIGTIIGTGMASWEGYRVAFTMEGSFDHKNRVTVVWAEIAVKLMTEPPQCEKYTVSIDVAGRRIEGHNAYGRLKLEPCTGVTALPVAPPSFSPSKASGSAASGAATVNEHAGGGGGDGHIATTMVPTMMSQNQGFTMMNENHAATSSSTNSDIHISAAGAAMPYAVYGQHGGAGGGHASGGHGHHDASAAASASYGAHHGGMMYGPQMTPQGITYTLMPTAMAMQAHAVAAQMLYGSSQGNANGYQGGYGESPSSVMDASVMMMATTGVDDASGASDTNSSSDDRSRSNSSISNVSPPSSGPTSPLMTPAASNVLLDVSSSSSTGFHDDSIPAAASTGTRVRRYSLTTGTTPRNRSSSDASSSSSSVNGGANNAPLQQFEIGDRVYMYTLPSNIVQSVLLRGPITAQALRDSPYPYHSPRQLHYNPGVLTRSEKRSGVARRGSQSRGLQGAAVKLNDRRTSGGNNLPSSNDTSSATSISSPSNSQQQGDTRGDDTSQSAAAPSSSSSSVVHQAPPQQQQQQRVVGMSATGSVNKKVANSKWPTIKAVRASSGSNTN